MYLRDFIDENELSISENLVEMRIESSKAFPLTYKIKGIKNG